jgi:hypothetical protein
MSVGAHHLAPGVVALDVDRPVPRPVILAMSASPDVVAFDDAEAACCCPRGAAAAAGAACSAVRAFGRDELPDVGSVGRRSRRPLRTGVAATSADPSPSEAEISRRAARDERPSVKDAICVSRFWRFGGCFLHFGPKFVSSS